MMTMRQAAPKCENDARAAPGRGMRRCRIGKPVPLTDIVVSGTIIGAVLALVTFTVAATGGVPNPLVHLCYIPILYGAVRHGRLGALVVAAVAGLAVGPWMPAPQVASGHQALGDWLVRLALFVLVGVVAAWLARQDARPIDLLLHDVVIGQRLRAAVRQRRMHVHYQPLVELDEGRVVGVEALCRWNDNRARPISPAQFIPAAEHTGAIIPLGREVLRLATAQANETARVQGDGLILSVNVSAVQLNCQEFLGALEALIGPAAERHYQLCIEITETAIVSDPDRALLTLSAAKEMGAIIAIDDFGTGQSSLAYLAGFPIDIIKIDRSFVATVDVDKTARALVSAVVRIAAALGATTIAEGIERPSQLRALRELGCDMGQGYYLGRPTEGDAVDWNRRPLS